MTWDYHLYSLFNNYILSRCGKITLVIVVGGAVVAVAYILEEFMKKQKFDFHLVQLT